MTLEEAIAIEEQAAFLWECKAGRKTGSLKKRAEDCANYHSQLAEFLKSYNIKFMFIISELEERAAQLESQSEQEWVDGDEESRLDEINEVIAFIKKIYNSTNIEELKQEPQ